MLAYEFMADFRVHARLKNEETVKPAYMTSAAVHRRAVDRAELLLLLRLHEWSRRRCGRGIWAPPSMPSGTR